MVDVYSLALVEAFALRGCPLCRVLDDAERAELGTFLREGFRAPETLRRFSAGGGFCRAHAWLLHGLAAEKGRAVAVADSYGGLIARDLELLDTLEADLGWSSKRRLGVRLVGRLACPACEWARDSLARKASFLVQALRAPAARGAYGDSDGLCLPHLEATLDAAIADDRPIARFLVRDARGRLERLAERLAEYDRTRDHRYAHERRGSSLEAWTDAVRRYAGEPDRRATG